jgi:hypothetical protein
METKVLPVSASERSAAFFGSVVPRMFPSLLGLCTVAERMREATEKLSETVK